MAGLNTLRRSLREAADPARATLLQRFFKTGPGQYGEGDVFLGLRVPAIRSVARQGDGLTPTEAKTLLGSRYHEERLLALLILVRCFQRGDAATRQQIFDLYLANTRCINNWDLVDLSAPKIVGAWLLGNDRAVLDELSLSANLWERRIAVLATFAFIAQGQFDDSLRLCRRLLTDRHDLMHKACGWMLREIGKRDEGALEQFLAAHAAQMPRTMLRYAIERMPPAQRKIWLESGK
jgi:3-methyladenine DNA glycosylase AlkD